MQQYATGGSPTAPPGQSPHTPSNIVKQESDFNTAPGTPDSRQGFKPAYKFVQEDGGSRFMESRVFGTIFEEVCILQHSLLR